MIERVTKLPEKWEPEQWVYVDWKPQKQHLSCVPMKAKMLRLSLFPGEGIIVQLGGEEYILKTKEIVEAIKRLSDTPEEELEKLEMFG
jgi:hypothetical protein